MKGVYDVKIFTDEFTGSVRKIVKKKALIITASSLVGITAIGIGFRSAYLAGQNSVLPVSAFTENSSSTISISASSSLSDSNAVSASSSVQSASASASSTKTSSSSKRSNDFPTVATAPAAPSAAAPTPVTPTPIPEPTTPPPAATAPSASTPVTSTPVASSTPEVPSKPDNSARIAEINAQIGVLQAQISTAEAKHAAANIPGLQATVDYERSREQALFDAKVQAMRERDAHPGVVSYEAVYNNASANYGNCLSNRDAAQAAIDQANNEYYSTVNSCNSQIAALQSELATLQ